MAVVELGIIRKTMGGQLVIKEENMTVLSDDNHSVCVEVRDMHDGDYALGFGLDGQVTVQDECPGDSFEDEELSVSGPDPHMGRFGDASTHSTHCRHGSSAQPQGLQRNNTKNSKMLSISISLFSSSSQIIYLPTEDVQKIRYIRT